MAASYAVNIRLKSSIRFFLGTTFMVVVIFIFCLKLNKKNVSPESCGEEKEKKECSAAMTTIKATSNDRSVVMVTIKTIWNTCSMAMVAIKTTLKWSEVVQLRG